MVSLIILILLIFGFFMGLKRGLILQTLHLVGFIAAFVVASIYYDVIASQLTYWIPYPELSSENALTTFINSPYVENAFYNSIAFAIIFFSVKVILQIIASMLDFVASLPILRLLNNVAGAFLGFLEVYLILFVLLFILALTPVEQIQTWIDQSSLALFIIEDTPYLSEKIRTLWFVELGTIFKN